MVILQNNLWNAEKSWSVKYRTIHKMPTRSCDFTRSCKFTSWCHVINIYWPSFKPFWLVERKSVSYKGHSKARFFENMASIALIFSLMVTDMRESIRIKLNCRKIIIVLSESLVSKGKVEKMLNRQKMAKIRTFCLVCRMTIALIIKLLMSAARTR